MRYWVLIFTLFVTPVWADSYEDEQQKIEAERAAKLEAERLKRVAIRMNKAKALEGDIAGIDKLVLNFSKQLSRLNEEAEALTNKENKARMRLKKQLETFNKTALSIARLERMPLEAMAAASSVRLAHNRKGVVEGGRKSLTAQIGKNRQSIYELQDIRAKKAIKMQEIDAVRQQQLSEKKRLETLFEKQMQLLDADDSEKAKLLRQSRAMQQAKNLKELAKTYKKTEDYLPPVRHTAKVLPVGGQVVSGYNEKNKNGILSEGVTIETTSREPVVAILNGRVIYSDTFRNYGHIIILEHSDGSNSLYSGMGQSDREVGDFVAAGKTLGVMPKTEKPKLYLEIRQNGKTLNPFTYLAKK